jgi:hypothetical protein
LCLITFSTSWVETPCLAIWDARLGDGEHDGAT